MRLNFWDSVLDKDLVWLKLLWTWKKIKFRKKDQNQISVSVVQYSEMLHSYHIHPLQCFCAIINISYIIVQCFSANSPSHSRISNNCVKLVTVRSVYVTVLPPSLMVFLALFYSSPKVLLDYLRPMISIHPTQSHPSTYSCEDDLSIEDLI